LTGAAEGSIVELDRVLLIADGDNVTLGTPTVEGAKVVATSHGEDRGEKIIVFRYKNKTRHSNKTGHRQTHTTLTINDIIGPGAAAAEPAKPVRRRKSEVKESGA
jgi:large subunit ribosomal protein L21